MKGIGWFQADGFTEKGPVFGFRVTATPAASPVFYREKYLQSAAGKWRKAIAAAPLKLQAINGIFKAVKQ